MYIPKRPRNACTRTYCRGLAVSGLLAALLVFGIGVVALGLATQRVGSARAFGAAIWRQPRPSRAAAAIMYLVGPDAEDAWLLRRSLSTWFAHARRMRAYPIIIFHEGGAVGSAVNQSLLASEAHAAFFSLRFIEIALFPRPGRWDIVGGFAYPALSPGTRLHRLQKRKPLSYFNMIRWNLVGAIAHPAIAGLDYVMRLDADSTIESNFTEDIFATMAARRAVYAFKFESLEEAKWGVTEGLADWGRAHAATHGVSPKNAAAFAAMPSDGSFPTYYNNFEVMSLPFFTSANVSRFLRELDHSDLVYTNRWGDAPIRWLMVTLFAEPGAVWRVAESVFRYCHHPMCG